MKLLKYKSFRQSLSRISSRAGRNRTGRITVRHQGGGHKRLYRVMSRKPGVNGLAVGFEYDPNRSARLVKLYNSAEGAAPFSYALAPRGLRVFGNVRALSQKPHGTSFEPGDSAPLRGFEAGDFVYDVEMTPGRGGLFARSAGSFCRVLQSSHSGYARLRLPSGEHRLFSLDCTAAFGVVSNEEHMNTVLGKAGRSRWFGVRPSVRGVAMNPVDHPHGGGQGKTKGGRPSVTPWSRPTKGQPTRKHKKHNRLIVQRQRKRFS